MEVIAKDTDRGVARMLDGYDHPAILVTADYRILATNERYRQSFGSIATDAPAYCYRVSHGYDSPCDQAGEECPLAAAKASGQKERVLHVHQSPRGKEHIDVEMLPIFDERGTLKYFVELLKTVAVASVGASRQALIGASRAFNKMLGLVSRVGPSNAAVLLLGESGSGKELVAHALHETSHRAGKPFVALECAGLTETLFESELFGHLKGAFTGANYAKQGLVEAADGGTLFLDEIGDIPYALQVKLLRLIETGTYRPVGSSQTKRADFRLICATHKNLWQMVEAGSFRQDLYYRINVFPIHIPSLAERSEDVPLIANALLKQLGDQTHYRLTESAMALLRGHNYRGNIRELRNILTRATVLANTTVIDRQVIAECLDDRGAAGDGPGTQVDLNVQIDLKTLEQNYLRGLLQAYGGDKEKVAQIAGISVRSLYRKLQEILPPQEQG
ncbi:sigma-54-dependent Fis family transcriptional regulator [Exilibacterium tricleocarpae]|uniref:Sigma-54-dependent Fis family transcriptional regulator n=1 Tax=Exilibacterium tricleocarpae TaxID=2591008 RepID=A0A545U6P8_9GAMM|nr:sigma-54-dependent Fis family transcriptional regulator [Exilibacterium tricleocarpae]TQV85146.1 sigma-54-dependent Fis family transcriptional regulator [Exilibacterium tricleocarpae]